MVEHSEENLPIITHRAPNTVWDSQPDETVIAPNLPIIDAHHHFSAHWGGYFAKDLLRDMSAGHDVRATVYIQCGHAYREHGPESLRPVGETEYAVRQAQAGGGPGRHVVAGIVGFANLMLADAVDEVLAAHVEAGRGRFRGIRHSAARHPEFKHGVLLRPPSNLYARDDFRRGYAQLAKYGLSFDAWCYHPQLGDVVDLARSFPDIPLIVDHVGGVLGVGPYANRREMALREWLPSLKLLAACPNVHVKLGGLGTATFGFDFSNQPVAPASEKLAKFWRPYFEPCIDLFGAKRCMFESNFPVDRSVGRYITVWNAFKRIASGYSAAEQAALFHDTAAQIYRIPLSV